MECDLKAMCPLEYWLGLVVDYKLPLQGYLKGLLNVLTKRVGDLLSVNETAPKMDKKKKNTIDKCEE